MQLKKTIWNVFYLSNGIYYTGIDRKKCVLPMGLQVFVWENVFEP